jgi:hypothetical protein
MDSAVKPQNNMIHIAPVISHFWTLLKKGWVISCSYINHPFFLTRSAARQSPQIFKTFFIDKRFQDIYHTHLPEFYRSFFNKIIHLSEET